MANSCSSSSSYYHQSHIGEKANKTSISIPISQRYNKSPRKIKGSLAEKKAYEELKYKGIMVELSRCTEVSYTPTEELWRKISKLKNKSFYFEEGKIDVHLNKIIIFRNLKGDIPRILTFKNLNSKLKLEILQDKIVLQYNKHNAFLMSNIDIKECKEEKEGLVIKLL